MDPLKSSTIKKLHAQLGEGFSALLKSGCEINPEPALQERWHRRHLMGEVIFLLWSSGEQQQWGKRSGGRGTCPIVPAQSINSEWKNGERVWVGWREVWQSVRQDQFVLVEAAFTFFWGRPSMPTVDEQIFRVEWPQKRTGGKRAAMPHWQVDWPLPDLQHSVSGIHFGMAGWECGAPAEDGDDPTARNWRRFVNSESELLLWANRTLEYSLHQVVAFFPKDF